MFFQVDIEICNKDGICVVECPAQILEMTEVGPTMIEGGSEICIRCGHCVAVCPVAAVTLEFLSPKECIQTGAGLLPSAEQSGNVLLSRRSIRNYRKKTLPKETLEKALRIASSAPTGSNKQPVKWLVFYERKDVETIASLVKDWMNYVIVNHPEVAANYNMEKIVADAERGVDRICRDAPHMVFAYAGKEFGTAAADCHTAIAYLELALPPLGGGSCWAGYVNFAASQWPPLATFLGLPDGHSLYGAVMVGVPKFSYPRIPLRNKPDITYR